MEEIMYKFGKKLTLAIIVIPVLSIAAFIFWISSSYKPMQDALDIMRPTDYIEFKNSNWIEFSYKNAPVKKAVIIYPAEKVDSEAYAPLAKNIAANGYKAIVARMPLDLAIISPNIAKNVISHYPNIEEWYLAGHSLGGVMAAKFAYSHQNEVKGLILLAAYPDPNNNLSSSNIKVLSLYGTNDGFVTKDKINDSKLLLPSETKFVSIDGGNHSQMGWYGFQAGDINATISREDQQNIILKAILEFMKQT